MSVSSHRRGIALAGNMLVDHVKTVAAYPAPGMLATIEEMTMAVGGCVPNTAIDLAKMGGIPVQALGRVGKDAAGDYILRELTHHGVDTCSVIRTEDFTSFSDVIADKSTGERTFFHHRGANAAFCPADIDLDALQCDMLHIGYLLLLDAFDQPDETFGTVMARFLKDVQSRGIRTSIDVVSDTAGRFRQIVLPALPYCDHVIVNEVEGCSVFELPARDAQGRLLEGNVMQALRSFKAHGVRGRVVIHCPEASFCLDEGYQFTRVASFDLPGGYIRGSVGAGDAFCAGCLHAIWHGQDAEQMLRLGAAAAAANLSAADSVSGMKTVDELYHMIREWPTKDDNTP